MSRLLKFWPVAVALIGFLWWKDHEAGVRREGVWQEMARGLNARNAQLEDAGGRIDTVYRTDTITLRKVRYATDTLLISITDTVIREQVAGIIRHERDSCDAVIRTCEQRQANLLARLANRDSVIAVRDAEKPGWLKRTFGCAAGVGATTKGAGFGAACGVKWP